MDNIIENIGVVVGLVISGVIASTAILTVRNLRKQLDQANELNKIAAQQSLTSAIADINVPAITDPEVGASVKAASSDWWNTPVKQRYRAHYFFFAWFKLGEQAWFQNNHGALADNIWEGWRNSLARFYHCPGFQVWWHDRKVAYSPEFIRTVEALVLPDGYRADGFYDIFSEKSGAAIDPAQAMMSRKRH